MTLQNEETDSQQKTLMSTKLYDPTSRHTGQFIALTPLPPNDSDRVTTNTFFHGMYEICQYFSLLMSLLMIREF